MDRRRRRLRHALRTSCPTGHRRDRRAGVVAASCPKRWRQAASSASPRVAGVRHRGRRATGAVPCSEGNHARIAAQVGRPKEAVRWADRAATRRGKPPLEDRRCPVTVSRHHRPASSGRKYKRQLRAVEVVSVGQDLVVVASWFGSAADRTDFEPERRRAALVEVAFDGRPLTLVE